MLLSVLDPDVGISLEISVERPYLPISSMVSTKMAEP